MVDLKKFAAASSILLLLTWIGCAVSDPDQSRDVLLFLLWTVTYGVLGALVLALFVAVAVVFIVLVPVEPTMSLSAAEKDEVVRRLKARRRAHAADETAPAPAALTPRVI